MIDDFKYAVIEIRASGQVVIYAMKQRRLDLSYLQLGVDGPIEIVNLRFRNAKNTTSRYLMVVDDEGLLKEKKPNGIASLLYGDLIVGDAVIGIWDTDPEPDIYALPIEEAREIAQFIKDHYATMMSYD